MNKNNKNHPENSSIEANINNSLEELSTLQKEEQQEVSEIHNESSERLRLMIVSGHSGSGKTSALNILEDFGYYSIDNLPLSLVENAVETLLKDTDIRKIALGIDIRSPKAELKQFSEIYKKLSDLYGTVKILYTTAQDSVLVARFNSTYRVHPLMASVSPRREKVGSLPKALEKEAELLTPISKNADITIDTSNMNIHQLKDTLSGHLGISNYITVNLVSFGFKHGTPIDADFLFNVRILPNPHWEKELRKFSGLDEPVKDFFSHYPEVTEMSDGIINMMCRWLPEFLYNKRHMVTIGIGCTGGKHRSVFITETVAKALADKLPEDMKILVKHRDKAHWPPEASGA